VSSAADLLFAGGAVFGVSPDHRVPSAVAVRAGRVLAVGTDAEALRGPATEVVDLGGGLLVPGFQDAHVHPVQGGLERLGCDLSELGTRADYLAAISGYAEANPRLDWITGGGWSLTAFPGGTPSRGDLDRVVPDRPVFLANSAHHGAWVNSVALELAGINAATPDPPDGRIEREPDGAPSGTLHEGAMALVGRLAPVPTPEDYRAALLEAQAYLHSLGITAWQDAILGDYANIGDVGPAYLEAARSGALTARVVGALWWERDRGAEQIPDLVARRSALSAGRFRATSVKIMQDGVPENFTAGMLEPYFDGCGCRTADRGLSFVDPLALREHVTALTRADFQVHVHAIGDRAVREALDAFEAARSAGSGRDLRHHIAHLQVVHPDDVGRFAGLGVTATIQPLWAAFEPQMVELTIPFLGEERTGWQYPFAGLLRGGARLAGGSDWPVTSPDPIAGIHVAVNRRLPAEPDAARFLSEQSLSLAEALTAYTAGSAFVNHLDDTGRIAEGFRADLAVLDRNLFADDPEEIGDVRVVATYVDGELVFSR
jgi:predicted amidohydrolase YtcJ